VQREAKSWCKVEVSITNPKSIVKMGSKTAPPPPQGMYNIKYTIHTTTSTYVGITVIGVALQAIVQHESDCN
jgi:hypothetical protein